ncbi:MAG: preprotein translocase subunit SecA [Clostridiales bacterium]|jgi:preprotein translocase subunit SecA|nr:preprotein translocase subunit SecA [Clostridiales bacterium]
MGLIKWLGERDNKRALRKIEVIADKVDALSDRFDALTDAELQGTTAILKARFAEGDTLDMLLPEAFAAMREACWRVLGMRPFYVQLLGGITLHQGRIAEMRTGEGKTLVAVLPCYLNALANIGVHVVTVNDYLAKFQAEWMGKVFKFMGMSVGISIAGMNNEVKRRAYQCDITYCTNNELGFDYLRDNMVVHKQDMVLRPLKFAIVDEVDSILIDEARTPLIISGRGDKSSDMYVNANKFAKYLREEDVEIDEKKKTVHLTETGVEKAEKYFGVGNLSDTDNVELNHYINNAIRAHKIMKRDNDYIINDGEVIIVDEFTGRLMIGRRYSDGLHQAIEAKENVRIQNENKTMATITFQNFFRLYTKLAGMTGTAKTEEAEFNAIYNLDVVVIPTNMPMIRVDENDQVYTTMDGKLRSVVEDAKECYERGQPVLIGTVTVEKSEEISNLLDKQRIPHNVLNAKNHAREAEIIAQAGRKGAVTIATNMAGRGTDILLGGNAEALSKKRMRDMGYSDEHLAAATSFLPTEDPDELKAKEEYKKQFEAFKLIVEEEKQKVIEVGGLRIIGTERHESRRIDNQLRGRAGRQGDIGSSIFYLSMEDDVVRLFGGDRMKKIADALHVDDDTPLSLGILTRQIENAQRNIEGRNFGIRKHVLEYDDVMNKQREIIYTQRNKVLTGESVTGEIMDMFASAVEKVVSDYADPAVDYKDWDIAGFNTDIERYLLPGDTSFLTADRLKIWDIEEIKENLNNAMRTHYEGRRASAAEMGVNFDDIERVILLKVVDMKWMEHIDSMDVLRGGIGLRAYGQHDPVIAYKQEGFEMFDDMIERIREHTVQIMMRINIEQAPARSEGPKVQVTTTGRGSGHAGPVKPAPVTVDKSVGRNDPCPCGSGKKYKNCCGADQ